MFAISRFWFAGFGRFGVGCVLFALCGVCLLLFFVVFALKCLGVICLCVILRVSF